MLPDLLVTRPVTRVVGFTSGPGGGLRAVAGNAIGDICLLDFRVPGLNIPPPEAGGPGGGKRKKAVGARAAAPPAGVRTMTPPAGGSITGLLVGGAGCANLPHACLHAGINDQPVVVGTALDRFVRFYHRDTGKRLAKVSLRFFFLTRFT